MNIKQLDRVVFVAYGSLVCKRPIFCVKAGISWSFLHFVVKFCQI